jgi:hypothetical protein
MPSENHAKAKVTGVNEQQAKTRLLLALWDMDAKETAVAKGKLTKRLIQKKQKIADYQGIFEQLEKEEAIASAKNKLSLSDQGVAMLGKLLKHPEFKFEGTIVGTWAANALVRWIAGMDGSVSNKAATKEKAIASYDQFKPVALAVYDRLNKDYNLDDLVPIYRIRREIGDRVSRTHFSEWLLEMQEKDIVQLQGSSLENSSPDKIEDSISTELGGLRCYARLLKP